MATLHNKQTLTIEIKALEMAVEMDKHIRSTLEKFKHHKHVTTRFTDALNENPRFYSFIVREKSSTVLVVRDQCKDLPYTCQKKDFRSSKYHVMNEDPLTWAHIEYDLNRYAFATRLREAKDMLQAIDKETIQFRALCETINESSFTCFNMYEIKRLMKDALDFASKGDDA